MDGFFGLFGPPGRICIFPETISAAGTAGHLVRNDTSPLSSALKTLPPRRRGPPPGGSRLGAPGRGSPGRRSTRSPYDFGGDRPGGGSPLIRLLREDPAPDVVGNSLWERHRITRAELSRRVHGPPPPWGLDSWSMARHLPGLALGAVVTSIQLPQTPQQSGHPQNCPGSRRVYGGCAHGERPGPCPVHRPAVHDCRSRACHAMRARRGRKFAARFTPRLEHLHGLGPCSLLTLTVKNGWDLRERIKHLRDGWSRTKKFIRRRGVRAGLAVLEVTISASGWHPHLHVVFAGPYIPHAEIKACWARATGDSEIVDIRGWKQNGFRTPRGHGIGYFASYVGAAKFPALPPGPVREIFDADFRGQREWSALGALWGMKFPSVDGWRPPVCCRMVGTVLPSAVEVPGPSPGPGIGTTFRVLV